MGECFCKIHLLSHNCYLIGLTLFGHWEIFLLAIMGYPRFILEVGLYMEVLDHYGPSLGDSEHHFLLLGQRYFSWTWAWEFLISTTLINRSCCAHEKPFISSFSTGSLNFGIVSCIWIVSCILQSYSCTLYYSWKHYLISSQSNLRACFKSHFSQNALQIV